MSHHGGSRRPRHRYNEALSFIEQGLEDISISRATLKWGITVPWDEAYGGCTSWVDLGGLPADPAAAPSHPALSDVAFAAKQKGVRESLPAACWASEP